MSDVQTYSARWIFTGIGEPIPDGVLTVTDDRISEVGRKGSRQPDVYFDQAAILPGFVNAHTHLDLSGAAHTPIDPSQPFTEWLRAVIAFRQVPRDVHTDIAHGLQQVIQSGTTLLGDISAAGASWQSLVTAPCRSVVFYEWLGLSTPRWQQTQLEYQGWAASRANTKECHRGISPHAPYSVHRDAFHTIGDNDIAASHLAESPAEWDLIRDRTGDFVRFLKDLSRYEPANLVDSMPEIIAGLSQARRSLIVHGNFLQRTDWQQIKPSQSVVYCPRTHAAFGHPEHPLPQMLEDGIRVVLGTDSLASNPDLDIFAEARYIAERYPQIDRRNILKMITVAGAEALGFADQCGSLEVGKSADLVVLPLTNPEANPWESIFQEANHQPRQRMFRGKWSQTIPQ